MVAASRASGKLLMVGHVLPFFPEFAYAAEAVRSITARASIATEVSAERLEVAPGRKRDPVP